jgi:hypothetical protein
MIYTSSSTQTRPILRDTRALGLGIGDPLALHRRENAKLGRLQEPCRESWGPLESSSASTGGNFDEGRKNTTVSSACRLQGILVGRCKRHRLGIQEMKSSKEHVQSKRDRRENPFVPTKDTATVNSQNQMLVSVSVLEVLLGIVASCHTAGNTMVIHMGKGRRWAFLSRCCRLSWYQRRQIINTKVACSAAVPFLAVEEPAQPGQPAGNPAPLGPRSTEKWGGNPAQP